MINKIDLEWRVKYILDATQKDRDQILETVTMDKKDLPVQSCSFNLYAQAPDLTKAMNTFEIFDTSAVMLEAYYRNEPFWRVSYLVIHRDREIVCQNDMPQTFSDIIWQK